MSFGPERISQHEVETTQISTQKASFEGDETSVMQYEWTSYVPEIGEQIRNIEIKLRRGTETIKAGHRVKGLNPTGEEKEVPLSNAKRERLEFNLLVLRYSYGYRRNR